MISLSVTTLVATSVSCKIVEIILAVAVHLVPIFVYLHDAAVHDSVVSLAVCAFWFIFKTIVVATACIVVSSMLGLLTSPREVPIVGCLLILTAVDLLLIG